jgi:hypothetical protein
MSHVWSFPWVAGHRLALPGGSTAVSSHSGIIIFMAANPSPSRYDPSCHESPKQLWHAPARAVKAGHRAMISARPWSRFAVVAIGPLRRSRAHLAVRSSRLAPTPPASLRFLRARGREPEQSVMAQLSRRCRRPFYVTARYTAL